ARAIPRWRRGRVPGGAQTRPELLDRAAESHAGHGRRTVDGPAAGGLGFVCCVVGTGVGRLSKPPTLWNSWIVPAGPFAAEQPSPLSVVPLNTLPSKLPVNSLFVMAPVAGMMILRVLPPTKVVPLWIVPNWPSVT